MAFYAAKAAQLERPRSSPRVAENHLRRAFVGLTIWGLINCYARSNGSDVFHFDNSDYLSDKSTNFSTQRGYATDLAWLTYPVAFVAALIQTRCNFHCGQFSSRSRMSISIPNQNQAPCGGIKYHPDARGTMIFQGCQLICTSAADSNFRYEA